MKLYRIFDKIFGGVALLGVSLAFTNCEAGLTYDEAPESQYTKVEVSAVTISARELFQDQKIYAKNWNRWVDNYINTVKIGGTGEFNYKNTSGSVVTLNDGTKVQPGETVKVASSNTEEPCEEAPNGKLYVFNVYVVDHAKYSTANKGYVFVEKKFKEDDKYKSDFELVNKDKDGYAQNVILPIRKNELIGAFTLPSDGTTFDNVVEMVGESPRLGQPGDFTKDKIRYLVKNIAYRPDGVPQTQKMYEIRITFLPGIIG